MFRESVLAFMGVKDKGLSVRDGKRKRCRTVDACAMCRKICAERITA
jgi:hypothetical protein